jgi:uncharacterized membrane protein YebE (DUF533 family)
MLPEQGSALGSPWRIWKCRFSGIVQTEVEAIESAVQSNRYLNQLVSNLAQKPWTPVAGSGIGLALSQLGVLPGVATAGLGLAAGVGLLANQVYQEWRDKKDQTERNQLYYLFRVSEASQRRIRG